MAATWELAEADYIKGMKYREIAEKYGVSLATVKSWKMRHGWSRDPKERRRRKKRIESQREAARSMRRRKRIQKEQENDERQQEMRDAMNALVEVDPKREKYRQFAIYYLQTHNATSSYQRAYGCARNSAAASGYELLRKPEIQNMIRRMQDARDAGMLLRAGDIVEQYMRIAFADIGDFVRIEDNKLVVNELSEVDGQLLKSVRQGKDGFAVELVDKMKALKWLSDYFMLNPNDRHHSEYQDRLVRLREREIESKEAGW